MSATRPRRGSPEGSGDKALSGGNQMLQLWSATPVPAVRASLVPVCLVFSELRSCSGASCRVSAQFGEVPHAVQQRRPFSLHTAQTAAAAVLAASLSRFPPTLLLLQWKKAGAPLLAPPIESRASSAHGAASLALQPGLRSKHNLHIRRRPLRESGSAAASGFRQRYLDLFIFTN